MRRVSFPFTTAATRPTVRFARTNAPAMESSRWTSALPDWADAEIGTRAAPRAAASAARIVSDI